MCVKDRVPHLGRLAGWLRLAWKEAVDVAGLQMGVGAETVRRGEAVVLL